MPLRDGERKIDVKELGTEKGRRGEGKVGEGMGGGRGESEVKRETHALQFCPLESSVKRKY